MGLDQLGRRTLLTTGAGVVFSTAVVGSTTTPADAARTRKRAYVVVIDGCRPDEITATLTPNLHRLRARGLNLPEAHSLPVMETIPNHVMMMTGVRPDRSGVPANSIYDRALGEVRDMDKPSDIKVRTVIQRLNRAGLRTGTVLSKTYLYGVFGARATHRWEPAPVVPISEHAPDVATMEATIAMIDEFDPHLVFLNLGDIDRFGHSDMSGSDVRLFRQVALLNTDRLVGDLVTHLLDSGRWDNSMMVVLADHSMDWSLPDKIISLQGVMDADPLLAGNVVIAQNGGADLLYWIGAAARKAAAIERMITLANGVEGVLVARPRTAPVLRLGPEAGDVLVYARDGWRFSDPVPVSNPIPGNHGHPATRAIPFFISGGHPRVPRRRSLPVRARTVDVAPTVMSFFNIPGRPRGGWDGTARL